MNGNYIVGLAKAWLALLLAGFANALTAAEPPAKWTVMVYMNGDNDLEEFAVGDFLEMADVGSTGDVNIIVQFDRRSDLDYEFGNRLVSPGWTQTLRFRVERDMMPLRENAINRVDAPELNMGDPKELAEFVLWAIKNYSAKRYVLVIWDHGDGFRDTAPPASAPLKYMSTDKGAHRTISHDTTDRDFLYNFELQTALRDSLPKPKEPEKPEPDRPLAVLGFDACLMGMVEVSYAMRDFADFMVASEDLVPGTGWDYADWLRQLVDDPDAFSPEDLSRLLVTSYEKFYKAHEGSTTHSAVSLKKAKDLADAVSSLSGQLLRNLDENLDAVGKARAACNNYASAVRCNGQACFQNVDLGRFCIELAKVSKNDAVVQAAKLVVSQLQTMVVANYPGPDGGDKFGSTGLAIYFPPDRSTYLKDDPRNVGYVKNNPDNPVEFVQSHKWSDFLKAYYSKVENAESIETPDEPAKLELLNSPCPSHGGS